LNKATQARQIWLKLNAFIYGSQAFAKLFGTTLVYPHEKVTAHWGRQLGETR